MASNSITLIPNIGIFGQPVQKFKVGRHTYVDLLDSYVIFRVEDKDGMFIRNVGVLEVLTELQPRRIFFSKF